MKRLTSSNIFFVVLIFLTAFATILYGLIYKDRLPYYQYLSLIIGGILAVMALFFILFKRKIGVFAYPSLIFLQIVLLSNDNNLLNTISLVFILFLFTGYGLVFIIPKWKEYT